MAERLRILVLAYLISPHRGSEYAVAWNYVRTMRSHCDLTVLYGSAGPHMGDVEDFASPTFVDRSADAAVAFHFVPTPPLARWLNTLNRRGILPYSFYLAYRVWHRAALTEAKQLIAAGKFDLVHYLGPIGYREPGYLWQLPLPYVWGPMGGATSFPWRMLPALTGKGRIRLVARSLINVVQLHLSKRVTKALQRVDALMTATTENQAIFKRLKGVDSRYLPENGIEGAIIFNPGKFPAKKLRVLWIGSLEARKGLILLINALGLIEDRHRIHVDILGDGPLRADLEQRANSLGLADVVEWHGQVPRERVLALTDQSHLHVVTGLNEGNPTSIWEAFSRSVPVLTLDHCGMHDVVASPYGIRIPVTDVEQCSRDIAVALQELLDAPERVKAMAVACVTECDRFRLVHRPRILLETYHLAIDRHQARRNA